MIKEYQITDDEGNILGESCNESVKQHFIYSLSKNKMISFPEMCYCGWNCIPSYYDYPTQFDLFDNENILDTYFEPAGDSEDGAAAYFAVITWTGDTSILEVGKTYKIGFKGEKAFGTFEVID